jgi:phospholipid-binding lipoprotein MlaA
VRAGQARLRAAALAGVLLASAGCATTATDPRDPLEGYNRAMQTFNDTLDDAFIKPVSRAYKAVAPDPLRGMVRNFFSNIDDVFNGANNILQGKFLDGWTDWFRVIVNTTFGVFGINDVASDMRLEKHNEDFGQTFAVWGVGDGPYLVLPFFGPYTLRDSGALILDWELDPVVRARPIALRNTLIGTRFISKRTDFLDASAFFEQASLDRYVFLRDAYLQRRRSLIYDGNPPRPPRPQEPQE